jgi:hypothetical protein
MKNLKMLGKPTVLSNSSANILKRRKYKVDYLNSTRKLFHSFFSVKDHFILISSHKKLKKKKIIKKKKIQQEIKY